MDEALKGLYQHCEGSMLDRCGECPYHEPDYNNPCAGIDCRDRLIIALNELMREQQKQIESLESALDNISMMGHECQNMT